MKVRFTSTTKGEVSCLTYTIKIYDENYIGDTPEATFVMEAPGFERTVEPVTEIVAAFGAMPSTVSLNIHVDPTKEGVINNWLRNQLPTAQENRFHLEILRGDEDSVEGTEVYFRGTMLADGLVIPDECGEYAARLTFSDGLSFLQGFTDFPPLGLGKLGTARVITFIQRILSNIPGINLWNDTEDFIRTHVRWYDALNTGADDPLFENHLLPDGVLYKVDENSATAVESVSLLDQLNILVKAFHCRIFQESGVWWVVQVDAYREPEMMLYAYNRKTPFFGSSIDETIIRNANGALDYGIDVGISEQVLPFLGGETNFTFLPALKKAVLTLEDDLDPIGEILAQNLLAVVDPAINPNQTVPRDQVWLTPGIIQIVPDATLRVYGRVRFWDLSLFEIVNLIRTPYFTFDFRINGSGITPFGVAPVVGPTQQFIQVSSNGPLRRYEFLVEFDLSLNQQIPAAGNLQFRVFNEGTAQTGPGFIASRMDIRLTAEYVGLNGAEQAIKLDYVAQNSRPGIKSSAVFEYSTPLGDVLTSPTVNPNGYLNKGALFVPTSTFPFRAFCGRWRVKNEPPDLPILSLFAKRMVEFQNLPLYQIDGDLFGDTWRIWDFLTYKGRRYIFNGGSFISDAETWSLRLVEITTENNNVTTDLVLVDEVARVRPNSIGPLTLPALDTLRFSGAAISQNYEKGNLISALEVNVGNLSELPVAGEIVVADFGSGALERVTITGKPVLVSSDPPVYNFPVSHTLLNDLTQNSLVFFDTNAINSIMPKLNVLGEGFGNIRSISVNEVDEQTTMAFETSSGNYSIIVNPL